MNDLAQYAEKKQALRNLLAERLVFIFNQIDVFTLLIEIRQLQSDRAMITAHDMSIDLCVNQ